MPTITKEMTIGEVLTMDRETAYVFMSHGMHCIGCPHSIGESIEEASLAHGVDADALVGSLNAFFAQKNA